MTLSETISLLRETGTEQNRKVYRRHGVGDDVYGVSYAALDKLARRIKTDHALARELWATGNHDARVLATKVADPALVDDDLAEGWAADLTNYVLTDAVAELLARSPLARRKMEAWTRSSAEWVGRAGWQLLTHLAMKDTGLPADYFRTYLAVIEREVHPRPNRQRDAMNAALIAIGLRDAELQAEALAIAERVGRVQVDHGQTGCKTPDAAAYIRQAAGRRRERAGGRA